MDPDPDYLRSGSGFDLEDKNPVIALAINED